MVEPTDAAGVDDDGLTLSPRALTRLVRLALLAVVALLAAVSPDRSASLAWAGLLAVAAVPGLIAPHRPSVARLGLVAELVVIGLAIGSPIGSGGATTLPYLTAMTFGPAASAGLAEALAATAASVLTTGVAGALAGRFDRPGFAVPIVEWCLIAALAAAVGVAIHRLAAQRAAPPEPEFAQAARLLNQLRTIARQLPGTLDAGSIAERLLDELSRVVPANRGAVLTGSGGGRLEVLAQRGPDRVAWETSLDTDSPVAEAWVSQQPQTASRSLDRVTADREVSALVLPLVTGVRTVGLVALEADRPAAYPQEAVADAAELAGEAALRLETALLFEEVRSLATVEERQRLAREIHDGVAQELVMVGYGIDNAIAELPPDGVAANETLRALRGEVTRVITELRLSLFELRTDVDRHGGLGSAIADYARTIGTSGGLRVHLSLDETNARLPAAVESELLRIAQEAVTNARKHAAAANLWVSCEVDPPYARIEVSDDGRGIEGPAITGRYGMSIMAERADRVRATLAVTPRRPRGTTVTVVLSAGSRRGSVSLRQEVRPDSVQ